MAPFSPRVHPWSHVHLHEPYAHLLWVVAGWAIGFAVSAIFSGVLELSRSWFVLAYLLVAGPFLVAYARWSDLDIGALVRHRWPWGVAAAVVVGAVMIWVVQGMDASPRPEGLRLAFDLVWLGLVYGTLDALFLSVLPVVAVWRAFPERTTTVRGKIIVGAIALAASLVVNLLLFGINMALVYWTEADFIWFAFPLAGWTVGLAAHYSFGVRQMETHVSDWQQRIEGLAARRTTV